MVLSGSHNYFHTKQLFAFFVFCFDTCTYGAKTTVGKNAGALAKIKAVAPECRLHSSASHTCSLKQKGGGRVSHFLSRLYFMKQ